VPFRGDYFELSEPAAGLVHGLIYPVPDPRFPFLGVHLTRGIDGRVHAGPNAILALARNGYRKRDVDRTDLLETVTNRGFLRLAFGYWRAGLSEMARDWSKRLFHASVRRYLPDLRLDDLQEGRSGVRAQMVRPNGTLVDDFVFRGEGRFLHVLNAPSPAATASFAIGDEIALRAIRQFDLRSPPG
jgi:L-2-hydroxyglutarate oxidase LhgO